MQNAQNIIICLVLVSFSLLLSHKEYKINNRIINVISLFSIGFIFPFAISFLKLSKLSSEYDIRTIILVVGSFLSFYYGAKCSEKWDIGNIFFGNTINKNTNIKVKEVRFKDNNGGGNKRTSSISKKHISNKSKKSIYDYLVDVYNFIIDNFNARNVIIFIFVISFVSFLIEVAVLRFIPLFSFGTPHAYSTFHIFGIHYITTLFFLMPAIAILNLNEITKTNGRARKLTPTIKKGVRSKNKVNKVYTFINNKYYILSFSVVYAVVMSLLLVSRALLIMTVVMAGISYIMRANLSNVGVNSTKLHRREQGRLSNVGVSLRARSKDLWVKKNIIPVIALISFIGLYISITVLRSHSVSYLNDIFEMKENTPIFITQPYMYLTQGFENLNYLVTHNERFTFGRRTLAPLFSLLRTKKYFPLVTEAPFYQIKLELTSKPIIYDLYYDFSMIGTFIIMFIIGYIVKKIEIKNYREDNIYYNLFFGLICYYLIFSFFQSYLSLLDTWFYLIFTYLLYIISGLKKAKK